MDDISQKALEFALKSVTAKRQTVKEMRERLQKRFPEAEHKAIIERLIELNYLNDQEFCEAWLRYRSLGSPKGKFALQQELKRKGVDEAIIQPALEAFDERENLFDLAEKKWLKLAHKDPRKRKESVMRFLASRGFAVGNILEVLEQLGEGEKA